MNQKIRRKIKIFSIPAVVIIIVYIILLARIKIDYSINNDSVAKQPSMKEGREESVVNFWHEIDSEIFSEIKSKYNQEDVDFYASEFLTDQIDDSILEKEINSNLFGYNLNLKTNILDGKADLDLNINRNNFSIYNRKILTAAPYFVEEVIIKNGNNAVVIYSGYSQGAHCCTYWQPVFLSSNRFVASKEINWLDNGSNSKERFLKKDGEIYYLAYSANLFYFYVDYGHSISIPLVYKIDFNNGKLEESSHEFADIYAQYYKKIKEQFKLDYDHHFDIIKKDNNSNGPGIAPDIFSYLVKRTIIGILSEEKNEAIASFKIDFDKLNKEGYITFSESGDVIINDMLQRIKEARALYSRF